VADRVALDRAAYWLCRNCLWAGQQPIDKPDVWHEGCEKPDIIEVFDLGSLVEQLPEEAIFEAAKAMQDATDSQHPWVGHDVIAADLAGASVRAFLSALGGGR
jgi:hypothetical protein